MTTTNAELIEVANGFKASMIAAKTNDPEPGSILDLWLRTAAALESATTVTDEIVERCARAAFDNAFLKYAPEDVERWDDLDPVDEHKAIESWREVVRAVLAALTEGERR